LPKNRNGKWEAFVPYNVKLIALTAAIWIGLVLAAMNIASKINLLQGLADS
jgi:hypothetical protein